ncbi:tetratricopeptide repeat (TPR)-like superfamily protein [Actinidia rufa]|uniref:Tetratricopeptide repeat (TPR)-like superfamily protein n=1 Tax=Actinidia rufa TaxID=165716 RepID=A0A7J0GZ26_9ERIC|nr:tetratricopeptide repeat (TPR)-like superfamily protein [Actinidia rufa]
MGHARQLFDEIPSPDIVLWNAMFKGYEICKKGKECIVFVVKIGFKSNPFIGTTLIDAYSSGGAIRDMVAARKLFDGCEKLFKEMPERNIFSWNGLIGGYARNGRFFEVLRIFKRMLRESDVCPNDATLVTVLSACARLGALDMDDSIDVFNSLSTKDLISWNTIINGLAVHGRGADALSLFSQMKNSTENPDGCSLIEVDEGVAEFYSSDEKHPKTEEIYKALRGLTKLLRLSGYVPDLLELGYGTQRKKEIYP